VETEPPRNLIVHADGFAEWGAARMRCAIGRGGIVSAADATEGDGATPAGLWPMRTVYFRKDRVPVLKTKLLTVILASDDGWCDAPEDPAYNRFVRHPYGASAERLWRDDDVYDIIVVLGYNDDPVLPGKGSAIFLHLAREGFLPSEGCVGLARRDLIEVLEGAQQGSCVEIVPSS